jgi:hypothetical protein
MNPNQIKTKFLKGASYGAMLVLGGCGTMSNGPKMLRDRRPEYNAAVVSSEEHQLLENLVRLRYCDNITSLDIASLSHGGSYGMDGKGSLDSGFLSNLSHIDKKIGASLGGKFDGNASMNLTPPSGGDYIKKYLTPIQFSAVSALIQGGWSLDRVFNLCVERVNDLYNATEADGPTPEEPPVYKSFQKFTSILDEADRNRLLEFGSKPNYNFSGMYLYLNEPKLEERIGRATAGMKPYYQGLKTRIRELKKLADLSEKKSLFKLDDDFIADKGDSSLVIQCRSLLGVMFYLSQNVDVPQRHKDADLVGVTRDATGGEFNWSDVCKYFWVQCSPYRPKHAYVSCHYRGQWFYIADDDRDSKMTFMLVMQLRKLQTSNYQSNTPLLLLK